jgi:hypothetical protein
MNGVLLILFLVAAFHFCLYYCNIDFFNKTPKPKQVEHVIQLDPADSVHLSDTKDKLEKHLNELKQVSSITAHG